MKKTAIACLILAASAATAQPRANDNWMASGTAVRTTAGECVRNGVWTPATAAAECAPDLKPAPRAAPATVVPAPAPAAAVPPAVPAPAAVPARVTLQADALFDFDKSVLKPEGRARLSKFVADTQGVRYSVVIVIGHTDSIGTDAYNQRLGLRRAEAVKAYLVSQGMAANTIQTASRGKREPVADNRTAAGRALNRRVVIEVSGVKPQ